MEWNLYKLVFCVPLLLNCSHLVYAENPHQHAKIGEREWDDAITNDEGQSTMGILRSEMEAFRVALQNDFDAFKNDFESKVDRLLREIGTEVQEGISSNIERSFQKYTSNASGLPVCHENDDKRDCPALLVENAIVNPCTGKVPHGSSVTVTCVPGFTLIGKSTATCSEGKYDKTPSCKAPCPPPDIQNAEVKPNNPVNHGATIQVDCTTGYILVGNGSATCLDGIFNELPTCRFDVSRVEAESSSNFTIDKEKARQLYSWITGSEFLPDGRLLIADFNNNLVILFSSSFRVEEGSVSIRNPFDVTIINETTAIATSSVSDNQTELYFIQLIPKLQLQNVIHVYRPCYGIDVYNNTIYLSCGRYDFERESGHLRLLDMDGSLKDVYGVVDEQSHDYMFKSPYYVRVSRLSGNIYVSDYSVDKVSSLHPDGERKDVFSILNPLDLIIDDFDNVLICSPQSHQLVIMNNNGQEHRVLLTMESSYSPASLAYRKTDGALFVAPHFTRTMFLYKFTSSDHGA